MKIFTKTALQGFGQSLENLIMNYFAKNSRLFKIGVRGYRAGY